MKVYYAGIGSRETPKDVLLFFERLGTYLANYGFVLRSGAAKGADQAFENGCARCNGQKEIFLPWNRFESSSSQLIVNNPRAFQIAEKYHPYWNQLGEGARKLQARNSHQILGWDLETPSSFVLCWTKNGKGSGGTGQAIRIANAYEIPVFDAGAYSSIDEIKNESKNFLSKFLTIKKQ